MNLFSNSFSNAHKYHCPSLVGTANVLRCTRVQCCKHSSLENLLLSLVDAVHAFVQSSRKVAITEVVCGPPRQNEEEDHSGTDNCYIGAETQDVQLYRVERSQNCVQTVRIFALKSFRTKRKNILPKQCVSAQEQKRMVCDVLPQQLKTKWMTSKVSTVARFLFHLL